MIISDESFDIFWSYFYQVTQRPSNIYNKNEVDRTAYQTTFVKANIHLDIFMSKYIYFQAFGRFSRHLKKVFPLVKISFSPKDF